MVKFNKKELQDLVWDGSDKLEIVENTICETTRWSEIHDIIFKDKETGKFYASYYSQGLTECQDEVPYEDEPNEIECDEMHQVEKVVQVWEKKE